MEPAQVIKDYNETDYRTVWQKREAIFSGRFEDELARRLLPGGPGWFVDIGAGYGRLYPLYARPGRKVVLVDYARNLIELAAAELGGREDVFFVVADAYHLPFRPGVFSGGLSVRTFHHMGAPERFLGECARVLEPGGHMVVEYSNKRNLLRALRYRGTAFAHDHVEYGDLLFGTHPAYFAALADQAGLTVARTLGTGFTSRLVSERTGRATAALAAAERGLDALLGPANLAPMNFVDLVRRGEPARREPAAELAGILQCPACAGALQAAEQALSCAGCARSYPVDGSVLDLR